MRSWFKNNGMLSEENVFCSIGAQLSIAYMEKDDVMDFINGLYMLEGVPVGALIADGQLLQPETLNFFYLDYNWIEAMVDGALSIGRNCSSDLMHDRAVLPTLKQNGRLHGANMRSLRYDRLSKNSDGGKRQTGFLLRSQLVEGWPGIEVSCCSGETELNIIKLEHIGTSVLFCIVDGVLDKITLTEPVESLFFGFEEAEGAFVKRLASLKEGETGRDVNVSVPLVFRDEEQGLLNIKALAGDMQQALTEAGKGGAYFSALEFALQMIHERARCTIEINRKNSDGTGGGVHE